jgi:type II secretory pathway component PulM
MGDILARLSRRERALVLAAALFLVLVLCARFLVLPAWDEGARLRDAVARKKAEAAQFEVLSARYRELLSRVKRAEETVAAGGGATLLTQVETTAREAGVKDRITSMKPLRTELESRMWESSVEVRMERITLRDAVELLRRLQGSARPVRVKRISLKTRFDDPRLLDGTFMVAALESPGR